MKIFLKTGCVVCTAFLLTALFYEWIFPEISVTASANADEQPVRRLDSDTPVLALTFDVLGDGDTADLILDILEKYQIRPLFLSPAPGSIPIPMTSKKLPMPVILSAAAEKITKICSN